MNAVTKAIGIDIGGTKINIGLLDSAGTLLHHKQIPTNVSGGSELIEKDILKGLHEFDLSSTVGIGIGIAGQIEAQSGTIRFSPNLKWQNVPLQKNLSIALKMPISVTNDVRAATWAEWLYGAGTGCKDMVCLFIGTGIGSGIIARGEMLTGHSNAAGEVGHMTIDINGDRCTCGNHGCWEVYAAGWGIAHQTKKILMNHPERRGKIAEPQQDLNNLSAKQVIQAFHLGDPLAQDIIQETYKNVLFGVNNLVNCLNPEKIILGGGIVSGLPGLIDYLNDNLPCKALSAATQNVKIVRAKFLENAGMIGAGALAINSFSQIKSH